MRIDPEAVYLELEIERLWGIEEQLAAALEAIAEAMTSLATGPAKDGYAYACLERVSKRAGDERPSYPAKPEGWGGIGQYDSRHPEFSRRLAEYWDERTSNPAKERS